MQQFTSLTSAVIPLNLDNVDTDMIIPAQFLKSISADGYGENLFANLKTMYPDFIFNQAAYMSGEILLAKSNFGCGSSREHAVWAIQQSGIKAVLASSYSDIFFNNAAKNGLLLICLPESTINHWLELALADCNAQMTIDLVEQTISYQQQTLHFSYDEFRKHCLINGLDDLDFLLSHKAEINNYEQKHSEQKNSSTSR